MSTAAMEEKARWDTGLQGALSIRAAHCEVQQQRGASRIPINPFCEVQRASPLYEKIDVLLRTLACRHVIYVS